MQMQLMMCNTPFRDIHTLVPTYTHTQCFQFSKLSACERVTVHYASELVENLFIQNVCVVDVDVAVVVVAVSLDCLFTEITPTGERVIIIMNRVSIARLFQMNVTTFKTEIFRFSSPLLLFRNTEWMCQQYDVQISQPHNFACNLFWILNSLFSRFGKCLL